MQLKHSNLPHIIPRPGLNVRLSSFSILHSILLPAIQFNLLWIYVELLHSPNFYLLIRFAKIHFAFFFYTIILDVVFFLLSVVFIEFKIECHIAKRKCFTRCLKLLCSYVVLFIFYILFPSNIESTFAWCLQSGVSLRKLSTVFFLFP